MHWRIIAHHVVERAAVHLAAVGLIFVAEAVAGKRDRPAGMFLLDVAVQIGGDS